MDENLQVGYQGDLLSLQPQNDVYREAWINAMQLCPHAYETIKEMFPHIEERGRMNIQRVIIQHALTYTQSDTPWTGQLNPTLLDGKTLSPTECLTLADLMYWYADSISKTIMYVCRCTSPVMTYVSDYGFMYKIGVFDP